MFVIMAKLMIFKVILVVQVLHAVLDKFLILIAGDVYVVHNMEDIMVFVDNVQMEQVLIIDKNVFVSMGKFMTL